MGPGGIDLGEDDSKRLNVAARGLKMNCSPILRSNCRYGGMGHLFGGGLQNTPSNRPVGKTAYLHLSVTQRPNRSQGGIENGDGEISIFRK